MLVRLRQLISQLLFGTCIELRVNSTAHYPVDLVSFINPLQLLAGRSAPFSKE
jgi:hypothetical protein